MRRRITWPKDMTSQANVEGKALLAVGYSSGTPDGARCEFYGPCDDRTAATVFLLANYMHTGRPLDEAVALTRKHIADFDARQDLKTKATP